MGQQNQEITFLLESRLDQTISNTHISSRNSPDESVSHVTSVTNPLESIVWLDRSHHFRHKFTDTSSRSSHFGKPCGGNRETSAEE